MLTTKRIREIWDEEDEGQEGLELLVAFAYGIEKEILPNKQEILKKLYWLCSCSDSEMQDGDKAREIAREIIDLIEGEE